MIRRFTALLSDDTQVEGCMTSHGIVLAHDPNRGAWAYTSLAAAEVDLAITWIDEPEASAMVCSRCRGHPAEPGFDVCTSCVDELAAINIWAANPDPHGEPT